MCDSHLFMSIPARDGTRMMLVLTDVATRVVWNFRMQQKSDTLRVLKGFYESINPAKHFKWRRFHSDSAGELLSNEAKEWFRSVGIEQESSPVDTPELNA
ncbi:MAG: hypothetical protein ACK55I_22655, partial [bacterium]